MTIGVAARPCRWTSQAARTPRGGGTEQRRHHDVSASAQELSAQAQQVTSQTHALGQMAEDLKQQVAAFKLRAAAAAGPVRLHKAEEADEADEIAA